MSIVERVLRDGRAAWPNVELTGKEIEPFLRALAAQDPSGEDGWSSHAADLYLAFGCALGKAQAIAAFDRNYLGAVPTFIARTDPTPAFADEVRQYLRTKLLVAADGPPKITQYGGRGPLAGFVRIAAVRAALTLKRERKGDWGDAMPDTAAEQAPSHEASPELLLIRARYRDVYEREMRAALSALEERDRAVLRAYFVEGKTIDELAAAEQIHRATAARWVTQAKARLVEDTMRRLRQVLGTSGRELDSLTGVLVSELNLSLGGLIRPK